MQATDGTLALAAPARQVRGILEVTGLATVLLVYDTEAEAVQACQQPDAR